MRDLKRAFKNVLRSLQTGATLALVSCQTELPSKVPAPTPQPEPPPASQPIAIISQPVPTPTIKLEEIARVCPKIDATSFDSVLFKKQSLGAPCTSVPDAESCKKNLSEKLPLLAEGEALVIQKSGASAVVPIQGLATVLGSVDATDKALAILLANNKIDLCEGTAGTGGVTFRQSISGGGCGGRTRVVTVTPAGEVTDETLSMPCKGRRPDGLQKMLAARQDSSLGAFFARAAWEEAASVPAFRLVARDLQHVQAPMRLIQKALASAEDEIRHAEQMSILAEYFGAEVELPLVVTPDNKTLFDVAEENMREGCIHEMFAALLALYQAENASDPAIAEVMKHIAEDETQHAMLAWEIHEWAEPQLSEDEKLQLMKTQLQALDSLANKQLSLPADAAQQVGWPNLETTKALLRGLRSELGL